MSELNTIRQRIHSTVVLGMGTNSSAHAASLEDEDKEIPVSSRSGRSEVEQVCYCCCYIGQKNTLDSHNDIFMFYTYSISINGAGHATIMTKPNSF